MPHYSNNTCLKCPNNLRNGFTLIELIMVIVVMAIVAAATVPRFWNNDDFKLRLFADDALTSLRYAQKLAIASGCHIQITFTNTSYTLKQRAVGSTTCTDTSNGFTVDVQDPSFSPDTPIIGNSLPAGITMAFKTNFNAEGFNDLGTPPVFYFDNIGQPVDFATDTPYRNTVLEIDIGPQPLSIFVESVTGFSHT